MDTREIVARFEAERQALAVMDHPGIAPRLLRRRHRHRRADIYSLGVLLYELLAGARPFEPREFETGHILGRGAA